MRFATTLIVMTALASPAWALKTISIKNNRALIDLEGEDLQAGDRLGARNSEGKAKALLEVKQVKNGKAVAVIVKGAMTPDLSLQKLGASTTSAERPAAGKAAGKTAWGLTAGYSMNSMTVKPSASSSVSMTGSSFNASGFYQMNLDGNISARLLGGYESLNVTGTSSGVSCSGSNCSVNISYLGIEALVRYSYLRNRTIEAWAGAGLGFLFAVSKSSNVLDTAKISTNQTIVGSLGLDYHMDRKSFIPVQLDYAMYPNNNTSSASQIILRAGWGFQF